ncbi:MAG: flagellar protein G [Candidatus Thermoplasmatota archaeon]
MGFSLTGTHVVFFIVAVMVASSVSGIFMAVTFDINNSLSKKGERVQNQLDTEFKIINDNKNIPSSSGSYLFYMKNIGKGTIVSSNETFQVFVDGEIVPISDYNFSVNKLTEGDISTIYISTGFISDGTHKIRLVGPHAIEDDFEFEI